MRCPYCLSYLVEVPKDGKCPRQKCQKEVPVAYVKDGDRYPFVAICLVGLKAHGKSTFCEVLLKRSDLDCWPVDEDTIETLKQITERLKDGKLPDATGTQITLLMHLDRSKGLPAAQLLINDNKGEVFNEAAKIEKDATYIRKSECAIWLVSWYDLAAPKPNVIPAPTNQERAEDLSALATRYAQAVLQGGDCDPKRQNLVVALTKGDKHQEMPKLAKEALQDGWNGEADMRRLERLSRELRHWLLNELGCHQAVRQVERVFGTVKYTIISAIGSEPSGQISPDYGRKPKNVLAPLAWVLHLEKRRRTTAALSEVMQAIAEGGVCCGLAVGAAPYLSAAANGLPSPQFASVATPAAAGLLYGAIAWGFMAFNEAKSFAVSIGGLGSDPGAAVLTLRTRARGATLWGGLTGGAAGAALWHLESLLPAVATQAAAPPESRFVLPGAYGLLIGLLLSTLLSPVWAGLDIVRTDYKRNNQLLLLVVSVALGGVLAIVSERLSGVPLAPVVWPIATTLMLWLKGRP